MTVPNLILLSDYAPEDYINVVYSIFSNTVADAKLAFLGLPIVCPWNPAKEDKHFCFWHSITNKFESDKEEDRQPDIRRCEKISWISYVIKNARDCNRIWCWEKKVKTKRGNNRHVVLYLHEECYLVVLRRKPNRLELVTAYTKESHNRVVKERRLHNDPRKNNNTKA